MGCVGHDLPDWTLEDEPAYFTYRPDPMHLPFIRRPEGQPPHYTADDEERVINEQITNSQGFDIEFKDLRCVFNYRPLNFDDDNQFFTGEETTRELLERLTRESLKGFNKREGTNYQFDKFVKANYNKTMCPAKMFYITFKGKDSFENEPKEFQAKVCYYYLDLPKYISCDLKPEKKVHSIETAEKEVAKKPRLTEEREQTNEINCVMVV